MRGIQLYFAYVMARNPSIYYIKSRFSTNKKRYDSLVIKLIFSKTKSQITCNTQHYSSYIFQTKCRKYCSS